ncbi:SAF domain-containing protein [Actinocatenispora comari]|uniref:SAF domain-containing protein n=1 Tax=Actinocatenispora comari TaxID=2807577 RepID=A0A8J4AEF6_9ACTN|nr:SAF domain-containing protein [Actinocatenispora comari]GIL29074.1 hypothetical protein NUM_43280 [Actinocatenispora comari]
MVLAAVLIVAGGLVVAFVAGTGDPRSEVVAAARDVDAGQTITAADVQSVKVSADSSVQLISWAQRGAVVGHTAAVPMTTGQLITTNSIGTSRWPGAGYAVVAVVVKPGQAPPRLPVGQTVQVLFTTAPNLEAGARDSTDAGPAGVVAQVASVSAAAGSGEGSRVVSLRAPVETAQRIAAAPAVTLVAIQPD